MKKLINLQSWESFISESKIIEGGGSGMKLILVDGRHEDFSDLYRKTSEDANQYQLEFDCTIKNGKLKTSDVNSYNAPDDDYSLLMDGYYESFLISFSNKNSDMKFRFSDKDVEKRVKEFEKDFNKNPEKYFGEFADDDLDYSDLLDFSKKKKVELNFTITITLNFDTSATVYGGGYSKIHLPENGTIELASDVDSMDVYWGSLKIKGVDKYARDYAIKYDDDNYSKDGSIVEIMNAFFDENSEEYEFITDGVIPEIYIPKDVAEWYNTHSVDTDSDDYDDSEHYVYWA